MQTTDKQARKLMTEYQRTGRIEISALKAGMSRKTAAKYLAAGKLPSELKKERYWRTRKDPFEDHWADMEDILSNAPEIEGKFLFEYLMEKHPGRYHEGQLRTFQRKVLEWRVLKGPDQEIFFPQDHEPGRIMETDFTHMDQLGITISGERFDHMLCHSVLTYSNWEWGAICHSENMLALKRGVQNSLFRLGHIPQQHWTDHSTAATHVIEKRTGGKWNFNDRYRSLMEHYGMEPHTIQVGEPNENGDVESLNGVLKRRVNQYLLLRGSRDFGSVGEYRIFLEDIMDKANRNRQKRLDEELAVMRPLNIPPLPDFYEEISRVTSWGTINISKRTYSVPSRLKGEMVKGVVYEDRVEVFCRGIHQLIIPRLTGDNKHYINYRHIIDELLKKPGAFRRYRYREDLFPTSMFRWAYDRLCETCSERTADIEYLRILHKAAHTMECQVHDALKLMKDACVVPRWNSVQEFLPSDDVCVPDMKPLKVNLCEYDYLCTVEQEEPG